MNEIRGAYLSAAGSAVALLAEPAVARSWTAPSALAGFQVGGLAAHLAAQVLRVRAVLDQEAGPAGEPLGLLEHFARVPWLDAPPDAQVNVVIRRSGEELAAAGPAVLRDRVAAAWADLGHLLTDAPAGRPVPMLPGDWFLTLDDFLVTRLMEIAVHSDDLAVSVGVGTPELPAEVLDPVLTLLARLAVRRHGQPAVLRAFSRAERAPRDITAF